MVSEKTPLEVLKYREKNGYNPFTDDDGSTLFLAADGGGMATASVAGSLAFLSESGYLQYFDGYAAISGASGALAGALDGKNDIAKNVYVNELPQSGFISIKRFLKGGPLADLDVVGSFIQESGISTSNVDRPFLIGVTAVQGLDLVPKAINAQNERDRFIDVLLSSMHMPWFCGPPRTDTVDGGIGWKSTSYMAAKEGAATVGRPVTHVLGVASTPNPHYRINNHAGIFTQRFIEKYFGPIPARSLNQFPERQAFHINNEVNAGSFTVNGTHHVRVEMIRPLITGEFASILTTRPDVLEKTYIAGRDGAIEAITSNTYHANIAPNPSSRRKEQIQSLSEALVMRSLTKIMGTRYSLAQ